MHQFYGRTPPSRPARRRLVKAGARFLSLPGFTVTAFDGAVVATATRMEDPLQQVVMSISAVVGTDIERQAIANLTRADLLNARLDQPGRARDRL